MAELSTIARPYAEAAYKLADATAKLADWSGALAALAQVSQDTTVQELTSDPKLSAAQVSGIYLKILDGKLSGEAQNFVRILAENRRMDALGEIRTQFEALKNEREGVQEVEIVSAFPLESAQQADLIGRLEHHTGKKVTVRVTVDPQLIGGVKIVMGDKVIDASARAQLSALESALRA